MPIYQKFYVGPTSDQFTGQISRFKPFLIPSAAFANLNNMYVFREVIRKRPGALVMDTTQPEAEKQLYTRLRVNLGAQTAANTWSYTVPGTVFEVGQMFSIGSYCYTVVVAGAPGVMITNSNTATTATYNTATGAVVIVDTDAAIAGDDLYFYPAQPVMHLGQYEVVTTTAELTIAFDTQFAYEYSAALGWDRISAGTSTWTPGTKESYYWTTNWIATAASDYVLYVTNNVAADAMRYWNGSTWAAYGSAATTQFITGANQPFLKTCKVIIPFQDRLMFMNTLENDGAAIGPVDTRYTNRIRYSSNFNEASPAGGSGLFLTNGAGYFDLPTREPIVSAAKIKDVLIVFCERSVYRISFTGNGLNPFIYEELNGEEGVESVNSLVEFDRAILGIGASGLHACNGQDVERIDEAIPQTIFDVSNDSVGHRRVGAIRDYYNEYAYWTYNSESSQTTYNLIWPNKMLFFDYVKRTWAFADDSISAIGYFWQQSSVDSRQKNFRSVLCGNQQGWTFRLRDDVARNSASLQITNISVAGVTATITSYTHNLTNNSYVYLSNIQSTGAAWATEMNQNIYKVTTTSVDAFTVTLANAPGADTYEGCGTIERVSQPDILTKEYNFFGEKSKQIAFEQCNFYVDKTINGQFTVDFIPSASSISLLTDAQSSGAIFGTNILSTAPVALIPLETYQDRFWHSVTFACSGEYIQLHLYLSHAQLIEEEDGDYVAFQDIQINGMVFFVTQTQEFA